MKRFCAMLMTVVMCIACFSACDRGSKDHTHTEWNDWVVTKEATCLEEGVKERTCKGCDEKQTEAIPKADHKFGKWTVVTEQTCDVDGLKERTCTVCNEKEEQVLPKTGKHTFVGAVTTAGDCVTDEIITYSCSVCKNHAYDYTEKGNKVPDVHHNADAMEECKLHCSACGTGLDHAASDCNVPEHFMCDGLDHNECKFARTSNMAFSDVEGGLRLEKFTAAGEGTEIWVPAFVDGKPVIEIADSVLYGYKDNTYSDEIADWFNSVTYVYLPDTVKSVGQYFLFRMTKLETVRMPKTIENWDNNTLVMQKALKNLVIPKGVSVLGGLIGNCDGSDNMALESLTIPVSFSDLGATGYLVFHANHFQKINYEGTQEQWNELLNNSVNYVNDEVKDKFVGLTDEGKVQYNYDYGISYAEKAADAESQILYEEEAVIGSKGFEFVVANGEASIHKYSGAAADKLTLPLWCEKDGKKYKVTGIEQDGLDTTDGRYNDAEKAVLNAVKEVVFSEKSYIKNIGDYAFWGMNALEIVTIPSGVEYVGYMAFHDNSALTDVTIEEGVDVKLDNQFAGCPILTNLSLPSSITYQFNDTAFKATETNAGTDVSKLNVTFGGSGNLWDDMIHNASSAVKSISPNWFGGNSLETDEATGYQYLPTADGTGYRFVRVTKTEGTTIEIPATYNGKPVTEISRGAFNPSLNKDEVKGWLKNTVTEIWLRSSEEGYLDKNIKWIGGDNFVGMEALERVCLPTQMQEGSIGRKCFRDTKKLANIRIPEGIETLEDAFTWSSGTMWGGDVAGVTIVEGTLIGAKLGLPSSFQAFTGTSTWNNGGTTFLFLIDVPHAAIGDRLTSILDASKKIEGGYRAFFNGFGAAGLLWGNDHGFEYLTYEGLVNAGY